MKHLKSRPAAIAFPGWITRWKAARHLTVVVRCAVLPVTLWSIPSVDASTVSQIVNDTPVGIFDVAAIAASQWPSQTRPTRLVFPHVPTQGGHVVIELYNSNYDDNVVAAGNCVASPQEGVIDCDLAMIDRLIEDLKLVEIFGRGTGQDLRRSYREWLLSWVLAHELGHIVLKHGITDFDDRPRGFHVFSLPRQREELAADRFALTRVTASKGRRTQLEAAVLDLVNALIRKALCPSSFPKVCDRVPAGVGLIYDYTAKASRIPVPIGNTHPALLARFLRILYLDRRLRDGVGYEASKVIELLEVEDNAHRVIDLKTMLEDHASSRVSAPTSR